MKKNFSISICLILYVTRTNISKNSIIDITGNNDVWRASLNIHLSYNNELVIRPATDEFEPPSEISIDILVKDKSIYTDKLEIIKNDKTSKLGIYKCTFDSNKYLEKTTNMYMRL